MSTLNFDRETFERTFGLVIHVGDPRIEKPHKDMSRVWAFHEKYPAKKVLVITLDESSHSELAPLASNWLQVLRWSNDGIVMGYLVDHLPLLLGAMVIQPTWYTCEGGHISRSLPTGELVEKCSQKGCGKAVKIVQPLEQKHKEFAKLFLRVLSLIRFDTTSGEYLQSTAKPVRNILYNMPYALGTPPGSAPQMESYRDAYKGEPALLVAAGPSLKYALKDLNRLQQRHVILCVGRVLRLLLKEGIRPDFVTSVEMFDWDAAIFDGLSNEDVKGITLLYCPVTAPRTVQTWPGRKVCMWDVATASMIGREGYILGGNSVAHHQYNFAASILGCEPLVLVGTDLAYTEPVTHAAGTTPAGWPEEVRKKDEMFHNDPVWVPCTGRGDRFHPQCHRTICPHGQPTPSGTIEVTSSAAYQDFCTLFEILIARQGKKTFNACPNGQKINGTEYIELSEEEPV